MSRTTHNTKGAGYEYWSRRPFSNKGGAQPGRDTKRMTHRAERREAKALNSPRNTGEESK